MNNTIIFLFITLFSFKSQGQQKNNLRKCPENHTHQGQFFIQSIINNQRVYFVDENNARIFSFLLKNDIISIPAFFKLHGLEVYNDNTNYCRDYKINYTGIGILVNSILIKSSENKINSNENIVIYTSIQQNGSSGICIPVKGLKSLKCLSRKNIVGKPTLCIYDL